MNHALYQKGKKVKNKVKEKVYYLKNKIKHSISLANYKIHRKNNLNRADNYVSIAIALLIITASWLATIDWLFWVGVLSILSNAFLLIINPIKK
ncbi:hypothetical protein H5P36_24540 [Bacillus sp. APMAM]|nr:hypothetical protein [Bacillus sp. APMAM]RTZ53257.1 hypothetical protein EKO25_24320 [Bacillus sp. SAJ1]